MKTGTDQKINLILKQSLLGTLIAWCLLALLMLVGTVFIQNEYVAVDMLTALGLAAKFLAVFLGALFSSYCMKFINIWGYTALVMLYVLSELCVAVLFFDQINMGFLAGVIPIVFAGILAIIVGKKGNSRTKKGRRKTHPR